MMSVSSPPIPIPRTNLGLTLCFQQSPLHGCQLHLLSPYTPVYVSLPVPQWKANLLQESHCMCHPVLGIILFSLHSSEKERVESLTLTFLQHQLRRLCAGSRLGKAEKKFLPDGRCFGKGNLEKCVTSFCFSNTSPQTQWPEKHIRYLTALEAESQSICPPGLTSRGLQGWLLLESLGENLIP